jgi:hypothetical protein
MVVVQTSTENAPGFDKAKRSDLSKKIMNEERHNWP